MLDQFFASLPKTALALLAIIAGFVVIVIYDPPRTVCDSQIELFRQQQKDFLYGADGASGSTRPPLAKSMYSRCQESNSPGGCFELFIRLKKLNQDLNLIPKQCSEAVSSDEPLETWLFKSMKLMTLISWGDRGPASISRRAAWFDESDLSIYCQMKTLATRIYGIEKLETWRDEVLGSLPESDKMSHDSVFEKSLFSISCSS